MARPALLTDDQKIFITDIKREIPDLTAAEITGAVWSYLVLKEEHDNRKLDGEDILRIENEQLSESAIISFLTDLKNRMKAKADNPLDKEWTLETLSDKRWTFPSESLPYLLKVNEVANKGGMRLSIRQAVWVSQLYALPQYEPTVSNGIQAFNTLSILRFHNKVRDLWSLSWHLSVYQETCELAGTPYDYRPFQAPSIALMLSKLRSYMYDHIKEMGLAISHSEIIGKEDYVFDKEQTNERADSQKR
jgi:hypothetical protein